MRIVFLALIFASFSVGCTSQEAEKERVVVYCALDREFSEPILNEFAESRNVLVGMKFDIESTKTVGLVNALIHEQARPRCDVFWNNEILHTLRLEKLGLLEAYEVPTAEKYPADFRSPNHTWYGFAARARVLIVNTDIVPEAERPNSIHDLVDPKWQGKVGVAKPLFGTTATHAAVLFSEWGDEKAKAFFDKLQNNAQILSGNKQVAKDAAAGRVAFGITDTDDAIIEVEAGHPVTIIFPDQGDDDIGTLFIPNTLGIIKGGPYNKTARRLVEYLLTPQVEEQLANGSSGQFPLHQDVQIQPRVAPAMPLRKMSADFSAAADKWNDAAIYLRDVFATPES